MQGQWVNTARAVTEAGSNLTSFRPFDYAQDRLQPESSQMSWIPGAALCAAPE
jgi:hypothetical protein